MPLRFNPETDIAVRVAELMCVAARTAPKGRGTDNLVLAILTDPADKERLAEAMRAYGEKVNGSFYIRDAENLLNSEACVLIGSKLQRLGIPGCNFCGFDGCKANEAAGARCAYNINDLGLAVGSAASIAADHRVDTRVMYSIGRLAVELGLLGEDVKMVLALPLSIKGKSPYFDRK